MATVTRLAPHDLQLFRRKRAPRIIDQRFPCFTGPGKTAASRRGGWNANTTDRKPSVRYQRTCHHDQGECNHAAPTINANTNMASTPASSRTPALRPRLIATVPRPM